MMTNMETKFNSQICTTREQSERLLQLGLKKETADMMWERMGNDRVYDYYLKVGTPHYNCDIPAWSLHRLCALCKSITEDNALPIFNYESKSKSNWRDCGRKRNGILSRR